MAGYGHSSVTGIDERTLGRIDLLLFEADYPDASAAVDDAWRVAVLAADPRSADARDGARLTAIDAANARRAPGGRRARRTTARHRAWLVVAYALAALAAGLLASPRPELSLAVTGLPAGVAAAASAGLLSWLEPRRAAGELWGSRVPALLHPACAGLWLGVAAVALVARGAELDARDLLPTAIGAALIAAAAVALLLLWARARRTPAGAPSPLARTTASLWDRRDAPAVLGALDEWWSGAGPAALGRDGERVRRIHVETLARLRLARVISALDEQYHRDDPPPATWRERRR